MKKNNQPNKEPQQNHLHFLASIMYKYQGLFHNLIFYSFLVGIGFGIGVIFSYHMKELSTNLQIVRISSSSDSLPPLLSSPPPSPPSPPSPSPRQPQQQSKLQQQQQQHQQQLQQRNCTCLLIPREENQVRLKDFLEPKSVMHNMTEEELLWRASLTPKIEKMPFAQTPKVAFMFLTRGRLPMARLWEKFFRGHEGLYSIYIHTSDPFYVDDTPKTSPFYGRRIPSKEVEWGMVSMVEAERRLLANALLDFSNSRFVLLSESGVPLFNFISIYTHLIHSQHSFVGVFDDPGPTGRGRYNHDMAPLITLKEWRKGSQWFEIDREIALAVVSDTTYFPLFQKHCHGGCYADEHYLPTFVNIKFPGKNANRTLTWTDWSMGGPHPRKFTRPLVTIDFLHRLRKSEEKCMYNGGMTDMCFLFARKFDEGSLNRFMLFSKKVLGF